jgi:hypothetical protein
MAALAQVANRLQGMTGSVDRATLAALVRKTRALTVLARVDRSMASPWTRSNTDQPGRLKNLHQMPLTLRNDTNFSRPQVTVLVRCGLPDDSDFPRDNVDQLISIRMQFAAVWGSTGHVRESNNEPVAQSRRSGLVLDERHA